MPCLSGTCPCFILESCIDNTSYKIYCTPQGAGYLHANLGKVIKAPLFGLTDQCYFISEELSGTTNNDCAGSIIVPSVDVYNKPVYNTCMDCPYILQATNCTNGSILYINGSLTPAVVPLILNKVIKTTFPGFSEDCWTITEGQGTPNTLLPSYSIFNDCTTCENTICGSMLNTITGTDALCGSTGSATVTPLTGKPPFQYIWSPGGQTTPTITGLAPGFYEVDYLDANDCAGHAFITINDLPCPNCYLITPCDQSITPFYVVDPSVTDNGSPADTNPNQCLLNVFTGFVSLPSGTVFEGCFKMEPSQCITTPVSDVLIEITFCSYPDCNTACPPPCWKIVRCDDPGIFYIVSSDAAFLQGKIFNNIIISDTASPGVTILGILPSQCWFVEPFGPCQSTLELSQTGTIYPDCTCCKTKCQ